MEQLQTNELLKISGGGLSFGTITAIVGGIIFIIGLIDGIVRPTKCN